MRVLILKALIALGLLAAALNHMPQANAQEEFAAEGETTVEAESAIADSLKDDEVPPPPEAPYPGAAEEGFAQDELEPADEPSAAPTLQTSTLEKPIDKKKDGTWYYGVQESKKTAAASFRGGMFSAPDIENPVNGFSFENIYDQQEIPTVFFDFEWQLKTFLGTFAAKAGSGIFYVQGNGKFADPARIKDIPPESFTFIMFPNTVSAIYRLRFHEKQPVIPYAEGGAGYFTFMELRDDGDAKFAGAPVTFFAGGAAFLLDWIDPKAVRDLDREYGINHVYLTAEYREIIGLDKTYDFSSRVISGGIMMEF